MALLYSHCQSQSVCYELPSSDCQTEPQQTKKCSVWNNESNNQCICSMNTSPIDVYFLLDSTNIDHYIWQNILTSIPISFLHKCSSYNTNTYIIEYSNNETNMLINPTISELLAFKPNTSGKYSSFCNTLLFIKNHIVSVNHNNPILLILITGNIPNDINLNYQCDMNLIPETIYNYKNTLKFMDYISMSYGIYLNNIQSSIYEPILGYHEAFQMNSISNTELTITKNLIIATICEYSCDLSHKYPSYSITFKPTIKPTMKPTIKPTIKPIMTLRPTPQPPMAQIWGKSWFKGRWMYDQKKYYKTYKSSNKHHHHHHHHHHHYHEHKSSETSSSSSSSSLSSSSSSSSYRSSGYKYGWNARYKPPS